MSNDCPETLLKNRICALLDTLTSEYNMSSNFEQVTTDSGVPGNEKPADNRISGFLGTGTHINLRVHSERIDALLIPQKRVRHCEKVSEHVHSFKNTIKNSTKLLKDRPVYRWEDPSPMKPCLSSAY